MSRATRPTPATPTPAEPRGPDSGPGGDVASGRTGGATPRRLVDAVLGVPLFYKILIANAVLVVLGAVVGTVATVRFAGIELGASTVELVSLLALAGIVVSVLVNAFILRVALGPLDTLEATAARVREGDFQARTPLSPLADRDLRHLIVTFNGMLDRLALYRQQLREVAARALNAAEEERKRIARELHDDTAQSLAGLLVQLRIARATADDGTRDELLDEVRQGISDAVDGVRRYARGLRPQALDMLGLTAAIESHARTTHETTGLGVDVDADAVSGLLTPEAELALYRIVQEALSNVVRHAQASRTRIRLKRTDRFVRAVVEDDGRGFVVDEVMTDQGNGLGLFGMQERAAYVGGEVEITSEPDRGTRVEARIPIQPGSEAL